MIKDCFDPVLRVIGSNYRVEDSIELYSDGGSNSDNILSFNQNFNMASYGGRYTAQPYFDYDPPYDIPWSPDWSFGLYAGPGIVLDLSFVANNSLSLDFVMNYTTDPGAGRFFNMLRKFGITCPDNGPFYTAGVLNENSARWFLINKDANIFFVPSGMEMYVSGGTLNTVFKQVSNGYHVFAKSIYQFINAAFNPFSLTPSSWAMCSYWDGSYRFGKLVQGDIGANAVGYGAPYAPFLVDLRRNVATFMPIPASNTAQAGNTFDILYSGVFATYSNYEQIGATFCTSQFNGKLYSPFDWPTKGRVTFITNLT